MTKVKKTQNYWAIPFVLVLALLLASAMAYYMFSTSLRMELAYIFKSPYLVQNPLVVDEVGPTGPLDSNTNPYYKIVHPSAYAVDAASLIRFSDQEGAEATRKELVKYIWNTSELPKRMPDSVKTDIEDSEFHDFQRFFSKKGLWFIGWWENLSRWESVSVSSPYVPTSFSEVFYPIRDNGRLVIWVNGHDGDYYLDKPYMSYFLAQGYTVAAFNMPTLDPKEDMAKVHDKMGLFEHPGYSPIQAFLDPIAVELNYLLSKKSYRDVTMMGISGGGWTTTVYAAVDPRIDNSYPVAGGLPFYLRTLPPNENKPFGDWELTAPTLYSKANLLEMYVLAASSGRRQMQVLNQYDTCCWAGVNARSYERPISEKAATLGGKYSLYIDPNYHHSISDTALQAITDDLDRRRP